MPESSISSAVMVLTHDVTWPDAPFHGSEPLLPRNEFRFLIGDPRCQFYVGWEQHFTSTNAGSQIPFATDNHYFYLLSENQDDPSDPIIMTVDHEETEEEPYNRGGFTVSELLTLLHPLEP